MPAAILFSILNLVSKQPVSDLSFSTPHIIIPSSLTDVCT